jgi:hypothetical protein
MTTSAALPSERDPEAKVRCSDWARAVSLSPVGTIASPAGYLLAEIPLPWPHDVGDTPEGATVGPLLRQHGYRMQAIAAASPAARPQDRRVILHARPPGTVGFAGYRRFAAPAGESLADTVAALTAAAADSGPSRFESPGTDILLCTHGTRDSCCGRLGASLAVRLAEPGVLAGENLWRTSHTGGHRFAPTFIVLPQGTAWGFADLDLVTRVLRQDGDFAAVAGHYRGSTGLAGPQLQALEAAVLRQVGWRLLGIPRAAEFDGTHARLTWQEGNQAVSYTAEVRPGRKVPMPGCLTPVSSAVKSETEWDVAAVRRFTGAAELPRRNQNLPPLAAQVAQAAGHRRNQQHGGDQPLSGRGGAAQVGADGRQDRDQQRYVGC